MTNRSGHGIRCLKCKDVVYSNFPEDTIFCQCGYCRVFGGYNHLSYSADDPRFVEVVDRAGNTIGSRVDELPEEYKTYTATIVSKDWLSKRKTPTSQVEKERARRLKSKYGLPFTLTRIVRVWREYSGSNGATWLQDSVGGVEEAFGVILTVNRK